MNLTHATFLALSIVAALPAPAAITMTNSTNVTLAGSQVESGGDTSDNPNVTGGPGGTLVAYTETGLNAYGCCGGRLGNYGVLNLNDGDIGNSPTNQDGLFAIPDSGPGAVEITFTGGATLLTGVAIYNGYGNRDDGTYLLKDGTGNILGGWTISGTGGADNNGVDSLWLTFNTPVNTNRLIIDTVVSDITPSFREIQVFAVPEPAATAVLLLTAAGLLRRRR